ncbi:MAG: hypothetical protein SFY32_16785 [Bacteroidota bacterium]|nr:hypothetical protein [Bacteroidota bacterium]
MFSQIINSIGLFFDFIGAFLLFRYGLPPQIGKEGGIFLYPSNHKNIKANFFDKMSNLGFILLMLGFTFQLISVWI